MNTLYTGDNLLVLNGMDESVDLVYLDPPFNTGRVISKNQFAFKDCWKGETFESEDKRITQYLNILSSDIAGYLCFMIPRLITLHKVLKPTGSIYLHVDPTASHYLKVVMDFVFGSDNFRNEIVWSYRQSKTTAKKFPSNHDIILCYSKSNKATHNQLYKSYSDEYIRKSFRNKDARGFYQANKITAESLRDGIPYEVNGISRVWTYSKENMEKLIEQDLIHYSKSGLAYKKLYLKDAKGVKIDDVWKDIPIAGGSERTGYPTQKPLALLERIIEASSNERDTILDPFCGSGTTLVAAQKLNRGWVGIDANDTSDLLSKRIQEGYEHIRVASNKG